MAKCTDCFHYEACSGFMPTDLDKDVWHYCQMGIPEEIPDIDQRCDSFKDSEAWVEVVRCKDCKRYVENKEAFTTYCKRGHRNVYARPDDFCSYGERRSEDER